MPVAAHQPPAQMVQLRQLHLQFTLLRLGAFGKNRQNQTHTVEDAALQDFFQIALLRRRQFMVEHRQADVVQLHRRRQLFRLTRADEISRMRLVALGGFPQHQLAACRRDQFRRLVQGRLKSPLAHFVRARIIRAQHHPDQHHAFGLLQRFVNGENVAFGQGKSFRFRKTEKRHPSI